MPAFTHLSVTITTFFQETWACNSGRKGRQALIIHGHKAEIVLCGDCWVELPSCICPRKKLKEHYKHDCSTERALLVIQITVVAISNVFICTVCLESFTFTQQSLLLAALSEAVSLNDLLTASHLACHILLGLFSQFLKQPKHKIIKFITMGLFRSDKQNDHSL